MAEGYRDILEASGVALPSAPPPAAAGYRDILESSGVVLPAVSAVVNAGFDINYGVGLGFLQAPAADAPVIVKRANWSSWCRRVQE